MFDYVDDSSLFICVTFHTLGGGIGVLFDFIGQRSLIFFSSVRVLGSEVGSVLGASVGHQVGRLLGSKRQRNPTYRQPARKST